MSKFVEKLETYDPLVLRDMMQELRAENKKLKQQLDDKNETALVWKRTANEWRVNYESVCYALEEYNNLVSKIKQFHEEFETTTGNDEERYNELFAEELK